MRNVNWPEMVSGIIPVVLLVIGLVPQFIKIYRKNILFFLILLFFY